MWEFIVPCQVAGASDATSCDKQPIARQRLLSVRLDSASDKIANGITAALLQVI